jgi:hypothetical protein
MVFTGSSNLSPSGEAGRGLQALLDRKLLSRWAAPDRKDIGTAAVDPETDLALCGRC